MFFSEFEATLSPYPDTCYLNGRGEDGAKVLMCVSVSGYLYFIFDPFDHLPSEDPKLTDITNSDTGIWTSKVLALRRLYMRCDNVTLCTISELDEQPCFSHDISCGVALIPMLTRCKWMKMNSALYHSTIHIMPESVKVDIVYYFHQGITVCVISMDGCC